MKTKQCKIILAPTAELAQALNPTATVEAEYGDFCIYGYKATLAHHGERSNNPAPCNWSDCPTLNDGDVIVVSHLDLDTIGGIAKLIGHPMGQGNSEFWKGVEHIDVNGLHHLNELDKGVQDKINAMLAWSASHHTNGLPTEILDVSANVNEYLETVTKVLDERHPEHQSLIENGKKWAVNKSIEIESKLISESPELRTFITNSVFCNTAYYSPNQQQIIPCIVSLNTGRNSITLSFESDKLGLSAVKIVQSLWGPTAGGRATVAGSPRDRVMTRDDLSDVSALAKELVMQAKRFGQEREEFITNLEARGISEKEQEIKEFDRKVAQEKADLIEKRAKAIVQARMEVHLIRLQRKISKLTSNPNLDDISLDDFVKQAAETIDAAAQSATDSIARLTKECAEELNLIACNQEILGIPGAKQLKETMQGIAEKLDTELKIEKLMIQIKENLNCPVESLPDDLKQNHLFGIAAQRIEEEKQALEEKEIIKT